jgi:hypothetical protein
MDLENKMGFLGETELAVIYNRWDGKWWGADLFDGDIRLQIGNLTVHKDGKTGAFDPFDPIANDERTPWPWNINLLERVGEFEYKWYGSYKDPEVALQAAISLMLLRMEE